MRNTIYNKNAVNTLSQIINYHRSLIIIIINYHKKSQTTNYQELPKKIINYKVVIRKRKCRVPGIFSEFYWTNVIVRVSISTCALKCWGPKSTMPDGPLQSGINRRYVHRCWPNRRTHASRQTYTTYILCAYRTALQRTINNR